MSPTARFSICLVQDAAERLLFLKRAPGDSIGAQLWGFPAGHIEPGETPRECALREMTEEIGPRHEVLELTKLGPMRDTFYGGKFEIHLFHYEWLSGVVELNEEHTEFRWVAQENFKELDPMLGIEEDIVLLGIWPANLFDPKRLPPSLRTSK